MAKHVYDTKEIVLQNGMEVELAPLPIGRLRRFMKAWSAFEHAKNEDDAFEIYINCCGISLEKDFQAQLKTKDAEKVLTDEYREKLEDILDMDTVYEILDVCGGMKLNDPKFQEAALALAETQDKE